MKILTYPDELTHVSKLYDICKYLGYETTNDINDSFDVSFHWDYNIYSPVHPNCMYNKIQNVSKTFIDNSFYRIFNYSISASTTKYGLCVRKTDKQADHSGELIYTPCNKEDGYVYQKLIDTRIDNKTIRDIRVPIFWGEIPFIYTKERPITDLFCKKGEDIYTYYKTSDLLSIEEIGLIKLFAKYIKLDFGDIDVLRDADGRIYIVDVNNIAGNRGFKESDKIFKAYCNEFYSYIQSHH